MASTHKHITALRKGPAKHFLLELCELSLLTGDPPGEDLTPLSPGKHARPSAPLPAQLTPTQKRGRGLEPGLLGLESHPRILSKV